MTSKRLRKAVYAALCGGVLFQTSGCESVLISTASSLISSYITEAILSGFLT